MPLSADRKAQFEEAFEIIGKKATEIERMDVGIIMRSLGQNPTNDEVKELFEKVAGGESSIPLEKMLKVADEFETRMKASDQTTVLKEAFAVFDKDNSGSISAAELRHVIANLDESVDEDETDEMMKMADADGARARGWVTHTSTPPIAHSLSLCPHSFCANRRRNHQLQRIRAGAVGQRERDPAARQDTRRSNTVHERH